MAAKKGERGARRLTGQQAKQSKAKQSRTQQGQDRHRPAQTWEVSSVRNNHYSVQQYIFTYECIYTTVPGRTGDRSLGWVQVWWLDRSYQPLNLPAESRVQQSPDRDRTDRTDRTDRGRLTGRLRAEKEPLSSSSSSSIDTYIHTYMISTNSILVY